MFEVKCSKVPRSPKYKIVFPYNQEIIDIIRTFDKKDKKWVSTTKHWELNPMALFTLMSHYKGSNKIFFNFGSEENKLKYIEDYKKAKEKVVEEEKERQELEVNKKKWLAKKEEFEENYHQYQKETHENLKDEVQLYPFQIVAAQYTNLIKNTLLALPMGSGKTICSITYVEMNQNFDTVIVITPNSLKFNYYNEVKKFTNSTAYMINYKYNNCDINDAKYIIVNYDYFRASNQKQVLNKFWKEVGKNRKINTFILDEATRIKNTKANTTKNIKKLLKKDNFKKKKKSVVFMSGTPAPNAAHELYSILNEISPIDFATKTHFYEYYCGMKYNFDGYGYETNIGNQKLEELFHKLSPYTYRKKKEDILDLPDKIYQNIMLEMSPKEQKLYDEIADDVANEIFASSNSNPLTTLLRLRQYTSLIKINYISDVIDTILDTGEKLVVVDSFKPILKELKEKYGSIAGIHTGDEDVEFRAKLVDRFQNPNDSLRLFIASIQTANYGLTLTEASKMIVNTIPYSVGDLDQVVDRLHRISQKSTVNIYFPIFKDTIDEMVYDRIESKRKEINKVIDNEDYESVRNDSLLNDVLNDFKKKYKR